MPSFNRSNRNGVAYSRLKAIRELLVMAALAGIVFLVVQATLRNFLVEGLSMEPTLESGQLLLANKIVYARVQVGGWADRIPLLDRDDDGFIQPFHAPRRGEVIVFKSPRDIGRNLIKRVVAVPGDAVEIRGGNVFVNGTRLDESSYLVNRGSSSMGPLVLADDLYWTMGDNRRSSSDSRTFGPVPRENVIGKAWVSYWPLSEFGFVSTFATKIP